MMEEAPEDLPQLIVIPRFIVVHAGFLVQFLGVEGVFGQGAVLPHWGVFGGNFTKGSVKEALGYSLVLVCHKRGGTKVVGVVVVDVGGSAGGLEVGKCRDGFITHRGEQQVPRAFTAAASGNIAMSRAITTTA